MLRMCQFSVLGLSWWQHDKWMTFSDILLEARKKLYQVTHQTLCLSLICPALITDSNVMNNYMCKIYTKIEAQMVNNLLHCRRHGWIPG